MLDNNINTEMTKIEKYRELLNTIENDIQNDKLKVEYKPKTKCCDKKQLRHDYTYFHKVCINCGTVVNKITYNDNKGKDIEIIGKYDILATKIGKTTQKYNNLIKTSVFSKKLGGDIAKYNKQANIKKNLIKLDEIIENIEDCEIKNMLINCKKYYINTFKELIKISTFKKNKELALILSIYHSMEIIKTRDDFNRYLTIFHINNDTIKAFYYNVLSKLDKMNINIAELIEKSYNEFISIKTTKLEKYTKIINEYTSLRNNKEKQQYLIDNNLTMPMIKSYKRYINKHIN